MAPESPGNLIALDLRWNNSRLECLVDRYDSGSDFLYVSWNAIECPENYVPIGDSVAYVWIPEGYTHRRYPARINAIEDGFEWRDVAQHNGAMLILTLPLNYIFVYSRDGDPNQFPADFKACEDGRMALYWWLPSDRFTVLWHMAFFEGDNIEVECQRLRQMARQRRLPSISPVHVERPPEDANLPSYQPPLMSDPPDWHLTTEVPSATSTLGRERGREYSMWLTGKLEGDNVSNVFWQCNPCGIRIPTKEEAIRHIRREHQEGVITPHLNEIGQQLAAVGLFPHATKPLAEFLAQRLERDFCRAIGAEPQFVSKHNTTARDSVSSRSGKDLFSRVVSIVRYVRQEVEQQNRHRLLTQSENGIRVLRDETDLQIALETMLKPRCEALSIDVTREGETGRGLLDFKFSWGNDSQCFLEVKKFDHPRLQHGLEIQLPTYLQASGVQYGIFVPIAIDPNTYDAKLAMLKQTIDEINSQKRFQIEMVDIRAWKPDSASKAAEVDDASRYDPLEMV